MSQIEAAARLVAAFGLKGRKLGAVASELGTSRLRLIQAARSVPEEFLAAKGAVGANSLEQFIQVGPRGGLKILRKGGGLQSLSRVDAEEIAAERNLPTEAVRKTINKFTRRSNATNVAELRARDMQAAADAAAAKYASEGSAIGTSMTDIDAATKHSRLSLKATTNAVRRNTEAKIAAAQAGLKPTLDESLLAAAREAEGEVSSQVARSRYAGRRPDLTAQGEFDPTPEGLADAVRDERMAGNPIAYARQEAAMAKAAEEASGVSFREPGEPGYTVGEGDKGFNPAAASMGPPAPKKGKSGLGKLLLQAGGVGAGVGAAGYLLGSDELGVTDRLTGVSSEQGVKATMQSYEEQILTRMRMERLQESTNDNLARLAALRPDLYNQALYRRKFPRGAIPIGGQPDDSFVRSIGMAMAMGGMQDPPAVDEARTLLQT